MEKQNIEFYINLSERNIVEEFKQIFEHGMTGAPLRVEDVTKSMHEDLNNQIDELIKGES